MLGPHLLVHHLAWCLLGELESSPRKCKSMMPKTELQGGVAEESLGASRGVLVSPHSPIISVSTADKAPLQVKQHLRAHIKH